MVKVEPDAKRTLDVSVARTELSLRTHRSIVRVWPGRRSARASDGTTSSIASGSAESFQVVPSSDPWRSKVAAVAGAVKNALSVQAALVSAAPMPPTARAASPNAAKARRFVAARGGVVSGCGGS